MHLGRMTLRQNSDLLALVNMKGRSGMKRAVAQGFIRVESSRVAGQRIPIRFQPSPVDNLSPTADSNCSA